jgi:acetyl esterase/lipase
MIGGLPMQVIERPGSAATLTPYLLEKEQAKGTVLICPGGAYRWVSPREGAPVAASFNKGGYHAFVLDYTVRSQDDDPEAELLGTKPLADAAWAMAHIREHAEKYGLNPDKIAIGGFSAGGHLAASLGVYWQNPAFFGGEKEADCYRPNALVLCYAVLSGGEHRHSRSFLNLAKDSVEGRAPYSLENHVSHLTPPTFLWHTAQDESVPVQNSLLFAEKLTHYKIPFELHIFPYGSHGFSLATPEVSEAKDNRFPDPHVARWIDLCIEWLGITF